MKKPLHPVALALFAAAVIYVAAFVPALFIINAHWTTWVDIARNFIFTCGMLFGLGTVIEIADNIRWNMLPPEQQVPRRLFRRAIRYLRGRT